MVNLQPSLCFAVTAITCACEYSVENVQNLGKSTTEARSYTEKTFWDESKTKQEPNQKGKKEAGAPQSSKTDKICA